jgi:hypothetical protein
MMNKNIFFALIILIFAVFSACIKEHKDPNLDGGKIIFKFAHYIDGQPLVKDTMKYVNAAGNHYSVSEVKYFISDVILYKSDGSKQFIFKWKDIQYVDESLPESKIWNVFDRIQSGVYDSISFTFGITKEKNISFMYVNPPEVNMAWPDQLGGGYHYLMINGFWKNTNNLRTPFNFHLGIGQIYSGINNTGTITGFVQNYFRVSLKNSQFTISNGQTKEIQLIMNIDNWFKTPHIYDHNYWGGAIMQNQPAMQMAKENGFDVFTVGGIH